MKSASRLATIVAAALSTAAPTMAHAGAFKTLYTFSGKTDGGTPSGQLVYVAGALYGVAAGEQDVPQSNGTLFRLEPVTGAITVLYAFKGGADGSDPVYLTYHHGVLYGTTYYGGGNGCSPVGCGTVFAFNLKTGVETVLYDLPDPHNGAVAFVGRLTYLGGALYGITERGGTQNLGTIFSIDLNSDSETTLYNFTGGADGANPNPYLLLHNGLFYGTTFDGGGSCAKNIECGTLFTFNPATGKEAILHSFTPISDGSAPYTNLIYHKGLLYGGTVYGGDMSCGRGGCGTAFSVDPTNRNATVISTFTNHEQSFDGLTARGASLYATVSQGVGERTKSYGELVKLDLKTNHRAVLHKFDNADGAYPEAPLTYNNGTFYGTTEQGGGNGCFDNEGCGTIFSYVP
jgi:uncharacterized repeat protein (TIGR03803 family)